MPSVINGKPIIVGLEDVQQSLRDLGKRLSTNVVRRGLLAGAGVIRDEARRLAPVRTGALRKSIVSQTKGRGYDGTGPTEHVAVVTIAKKAYQQTATGKIRGVKKSDFKKKQGLIKPRQYAHLVEFGTRPHSLKKGDQLARGRRPHVQTGPANHPGATAKPFMRPAFDTKKQEAIRVFAATVRTELAKELVKKGKGGAAAMALSGTRAVQAVEAVA